MSLFENAAAVETAGFSVLLLASILYGDWVLFALTILLIAFIYPYRNRLEAHKKGINV